MGAIATFDYALWVAQYPEFAYLSSVQGQVYFDMAGEIFPNDGTSLVSDETRQRNLLNMLTSHLAFMFAPAANGQPASSIVGRISNATEGSVSVATEFDLSKSGPSASWFMQTKYGALFWQATTALRTARYRTRWCRPFGPNGPIPGWLFPLNQP